MPLIDRLSTRLCRALAAFAFLAFGAVAHAGEYFERDGVAILGYDPVAYFKGSRPARGDVQWRAEHKGSTFLFASQANRDAFRADPERYAPQYGGFCAFGTAGGYKAKIDPAAFTIVDDKLYLNYDEAVRKRWSGDTKGYIGKADRNWPTVSRQTKVIE